jgi:hypothetical protein
MSALTEAQTTLRRHDRRTARNETGHRVWWAPMWAFLNSSLGLWFLSSVLLSTAVYVYQIWEDGKQQQEMTAQKLEKLNLEIAGRVSQFGTWARLNLLHEHNGRHEFRAGVNETKIEGAIMDLAAAPQSGRDTDRLYIHEILPDFSTRNLISLYAELNLIARKALEEGCHCKIDGNEISFSGSSESKPEGILSGIVSKVFQTADGNSLHALYLQMIQYREAEVALLSPAYLLQYNSPNHDTFVRSFEGIFLTEDTKRSGLPSTDCLENFPNGGSCISYPEATQSANVLLGG